MTENVKTPDLYGAALKEALASPEIQALAGGPAVEEGTAAEAAEATEAAATETVVSKPAEVGEEVAPKEEKDDDEVTAAAEDTSGVPTVYFGMDLSEYAPEQRSEIIAKLSEQNQLISKLQRERVVDETTTEPEAPAPVEWTDEGIIEALGLDVENDPFDEHSAKVALPLMRELLALRASVDGVVSERVIEETDRYWTQTLDSLEQANGELPIDRLAVLEYAAENSIGDPQDAYWRIAGPARAQLDRELTRRRAEAQTEAKRKVGSPVRSAGAGDTSEAPVEGEDVESATRAAATEIAKKLGII